MKFIRFQQSEFYGIYTGGGGLYDIMDGRNDAERHPPPSADSQLMENYKKTSVAAITDRFHPYHFNYGFSSIEQLKSWLYQDEWIKQLYAKGYRVMEYDVPDRFCAVGNTQMMVAVNWFGDNNENFTKVYDLSELVSDKG